MKRVWKGALIGGIIGVIIFLIILSPSLSERILHSSSYDILHFVQTSIIERVNSLRS